MSASVDPELLEAAQAAVEAGRADSISGWVNEALRRQLDHDQRMTALAEFIEAHESEYGVITEEEMRQATRSLRSRAIPVRGGTSKRGRPPRKRRSA